MSQSDAQLLEAWVTRGDAEAMTAIVRRHSGLVYGTCVRILRNHADAQDAAQECFIKLANVRSSGDSVPALLHRMATNQCLNEIRGNTRRKTRESRYTESVPEAEEADWDDIQLYVDEAIDALPDATREALIRSFFDGETHDAIAKSEGVSRAAITLRIKKGVDSIRATLQRRGITVGATALTTLITTNFAQAAPETLITELTKLALAGPTHAPRTNATNALAKLPVAIAVIAAAAITIAVAVPSLTPATDPVTPEPEPFLDPAPVGVSSTFESSPPQRDPAEFLNVDADQETTNPAANQEP